MQSSAHVDGEVPVLMVGGGPGLNACASATDLTEPGSAPGPAQEIKELTPQSRQCRDDQLAAAVEPLVLAQDVGSHRRTPTRFLPRPPPGFTGLPGIPRRHGDDLLARRRTSSRTRAACLRDDALVARSA